MKYQNKRANYVTARWVVLNWNKVNSVYAEAQ
ncbi:Fe-Mn family superoxide dismutase [Brevundimonas fontaquae]|nr:Fe-Mn family superoxide dismutase [Brevundimonas fontaquae]